MLTPKWQQRFMELAVHIASWSKDPSTQVGCVIVDAEKHILSTGYNGFPRGVHDAAAIYQDRPIKHLRVVHAEANAVAAASRHGVSLMGSIVFTTFPCCAQCAALLIQAGVDTVYFERGRELRADWEASAREASALFLEADVVYKPYEPHCQPHEP